MLLNMWAVTVVKLLGVACFLPPKVSSSVSRSFVTFYGREGEKTQKFHEVCLKSGACSYQVQTSQPWTEQK